MKSRCARSPRAWASVRAAVEPADLVVGGRGPAAERVDLAVQPGQPLAAVGGGTEQPGDPALLLGVRLLGGLPGGDGGVEGGPVALHLGGDLAAPGRRTRSASASSCSGSRPESVPRSAAPSRALRTRSAARPAVPLSRSRSPHSANQVSWALASAGRSSRSAASSAASACRASATAASTSSRRCEQHGLVGELLLQRGAQGDQVVGEQPGARVADVGLDDRRLAGHLGLPAQRLELAADLGEQVVEPGEVALGGVELAERLLLALAVLEDAGGLLDEAAPVLGGRVQDRVELALPDDHVHLAADAGVGEQLLDVEQPAGLRR